MENAPLITAPPVPTYEAYEPNFTRMMRIGRQTENIGLQWRAYLRRTDQAAYSRGSSVWEDWDDDYDYPSMYT